MLKGLLFNKPATVRSNLKALSATGLQTLQSSTQRGHCLLSAFREMNEERRLIAARQELGPDATIEQLALHCHIQRITPRIRKILRRIERAA